MEIRRAKASDSADIMRLLRQVLAIHHEGRPDLFKGGTTKYTEAQLQEIITDDTRPIFVMDDGKNVIGYAFCIFVQHLDDNILTDIRTLYIDDLCVDESARGKHVGSALYKHVLEFARQEGCYNVTLNVWTENKAALQFYEHCGLKPQKIGMEKIL